MPVKKAAASRFSIGGRLYGALSQTFRNDDVVAYAPVADRKAELSAGRTRSLCFVTFFRLRAPPSRLSQPGFPSFFASTLSRWPRSHKASNYKSCVGFVDMYIDLIKTKNYPIKYLMQTRATDFIVENGRVVGIKAKGDNGNTYEIRAKNGLVLATGDGMIVAEKIVANAIPDALNFGRLAG